MGQKVINSEVAARGSTSQCAADSLVPEKVSAAGVVGQVEYYATLTSTQDRAHELARSVDCGPLPLLVVAEEQTAGRGRGSNRWWTGRGSLAFSLLFDPAAWDLSREPTPRRSLAVGAAIVEVLRPLVPRHPLGLHWPNDVFADGRKLAGVLIDVLQGGRHVIGVGLNVNNTLDGAPSDVRHRATSLCELTGETFDRTNLLVALVANVQRSLRGSTEDAVGFGQRLTELCLQIGQDLTIDLGGCRTTGRCLGIDADGSLVLETVAGPQRFYSGTLV